LDHRRPEKIAASLAAARSAASRGCDRRVVIHPEARFVNKALTPTRRFAMTNFRKLNRMELAVIGAALLMTIAPLVPYALLG